MDVFGWVGDPAVGSPAVVVCRMVPSSPTAQPVFASVKKTALRARFVPVACGFQKAPPSVVRRTVLILGLHTPRPPTTNPVSTPVNQTPLSVLWTPLV
jgi:hypothetical protein